MRQAQLWDAAQVQLGEMQAQLGERSQQARAWHTVSEGLMTDLRQSALRALLSSAHQRRLASALQCWERWLVNSGWLH